jgi:uncharacterized protein (TIGR03083 family)
MGFDLDAAIAAYVDTLERAQTFYAGLPDPEWDLATELPGWSVQDLASHIIAIERDTLGDPAPEHVPDWDALPHAAGPVSQYTEVGVDVRRSRTPDEIRAELAEVIARRRPDLVASPREADAAVRGPAGMSAPASRIYPMRTFDVWAHLQDARRATGRPGDLDSLGGQVTRDRLVRALRILLGKELATPPGTAVRLTVDGAVAFDVDLVVGADGRAVAHPAEDGVAEAQISTDWETFVRLGCGRAPLDELPIRVDGDSELAHRLLAVAAITP